MITEKKKNILKIFTVIVFICIAILFFEFAGYPSEPIYELEDVSEYIIETPCSSRNITIRKYFLIQNPPSDSKELLKTAKNYLYNTENIKKQFDEEIGKWDDDTKILIRITFFKKSPIMPGLHRFGIAWGDDEISDEPYSEYKVLFYTLSYDHGVCTEYFTPGLNSEEFYLGIVYDKQTYDYEKS